MPRRKHPRQRRRTEPGLPPGTLIADPAAARPVVTLFAFNADRFVEKQTDDLDTLRECLQKWPITWINVDGLGDVDLISRLGEVLHLHRLALEDTVNTHQRAKAEQYHDHLFFVAQMASNGHHLETEQLSLFLGPNFVVTFQEGRPGDPFESVRQRIRQAGSHVRQAGADYLAYCLIDAVIDGYFPVLEAMGERLEALEDVVIDQPSREAVFAIHDARRELMTLRRLVWPLREVMNNLLRDPTPLIADETRLYLRDCYDHAVRILDFVETCRELASDLMDLYLSSVNQRMTEVMKVLTIIATIFIPLTFIAGVYGMNFHPDASPLNMPELTWYFGYPTALALMAAAALVMLYYFRRKGWLGAAVPPNPPACPPNHDPHDPSNHGRV